MNIYEYFFDHANDAIFIHDLDGNFLEVNKTACERLGYSRKELLSMEPRDIDSSTFAHRYEERVTRLKKQNAIVFETVHVTKEGDKIPIELSSSIVQYKGRKAILSVARDISQRKKALKELKKSQEQYQKAYQRAEFYKDLFAHDIGNLLQSIKSSADLLSDLFEERNITSKIEEVIEIVDNQVTRGAHLIENVRSLSSIETKKKAQKKKELTNSLESAITFLKSNFPKKEIKINTKIPFEEIYVKGNELLEHVFENILMNSVHHNEHKVIKINIEVSKPEREESGENWIKIEFIDNGIGIPDGLKNQILKGKYHKREGSKGMGLGLTLVKKALDMFDAEMEIENRDPEDYSKGTNIILFFQEVK